MFNWLVNNSVWILLGSSIVVLALVFFNDRIRAWLARIAPERWRGKFYGNMNAFFWAVTALTGMIMIVSFTLMALFRDSDVPRITSKAVEEWFMSHGIRVVIILLVGMALWFFVRHTLPPLVDRTIGRPQKGESREGVKKRANTLLSVFLGLSKGIILLIVIFMVLAELGVQIGPMLAGFGIAGVAVGLGAQYLIKDLIAGIFILMENEYRVGDVVRVADITGLVEEITLRKTVLRDLDGTVHHVPNGEIRVASNFSRHFARVNLNVPVAYDTDLDYAIRVINDVCREMAADEKWASVLRTVPQVLRVDKLGDSGIEIKIVGEVKPMEQWNVMGELRLRLKKAFDKAGIEIPYPHMKVYFGNRPE
ncbi:MAG: mechanosensitive ion channel family protein [Dehalococcoidales bacterium]|nr:mechanosensitive ion channel family protein [Dehalococcoidales bacterium]